MLAVVFVLLAQAQNVGLAAPHSMQDWMNIMPEINQALDAAFAGERIQGQYPQGILQPSHVADLIGDKTTVALVSFGVGGAYTSALTLLRIASGKPVVARFKDRTGKVSSMSFAQGASVVHASFVDLLPAEHALLAMHVEYGGNGKLGDCGGEVCQWNRVTETFDFNSGLSKRLGGQKCAEVAKTLPRF
jgi:hypothetical protein